MPDDVYGDPPSPEAVAALVAVLGMAIDRYVKNRARRTIVENAKADPAKPKCRWVVEVDACDFCKARGGFLYDPSETPSDSHGGCKCHPEAVYTPVESSSARRVETKVKTEVPDATNLATDEGIAIRDSQKLQKAFKPETAGRLGVDVENALLSGDATRANAARVFVCAVKGDAKYRRVRNIERPHYNPARKEVEVPIKLDVQPKTVVHETFHLADRQGTVRHGSDGSLVASTAEYSSHRFSTGKGYIRTMLKEDWASIKAAASSEGKGVEAYLLESLETMGLEETYYGRAFFSDFVDAASNGDIQLGWAHTYKDAAYWTKRGGENIGTECLSNYGGAAICNEVEYRAIKVFFPKTSGTLDELLEAMVHAD